jgi:hypothetical protein
MHIDVGVSRRGMCGFFLTTLDMLFSVLNIPCITPSTSNERDKNDMEALFVILYNLYNLLVSIFKNCGNGL